MLKFIAAFLFCTLILPEIGAQDKEFSAYDKNSDNKLSQEEFEDMMRDAKLFSPWDRNGNNYLNIEEWADALEEMYPQKDLFSQKTFREWDLDADHAVNDREFREGLFNTWDQNGNEFISEEEFSFWRYEGNTVNKSRAGEEGR